MSDRFPAHITIGGDLSPQTLAELVHAIEMDGAKVEGDAQIADEKYLRASIAAGESVRLHDPEASYGRFEDLERFCQENNLTFQRHSMAWFEYDAEFSYWSPGMQEPRSVHADQNGNRVLIPLGDLEDALAEGRTLAEVIASDKPAMADVPPLRLEPDLG